MADQDFNINIRTTANTAGIEQIKSALTGLGAQVNSINAASGGGGGGGGDLLDKAAAKIEHGIFRTAVHAIGIGVVYELVGALKRAGEEIEKVSEELDKQGAKLVSNAQLYSEATKFATTQADVVKIGSAAMKDMEEEHKKVVELQKQELGYAAQFSDFLNVQLFKNRGKTEGDYEAARRINLETAEQLETAARQNALLDIQAAKLIEARHAAQSYEETVAELNQRQKEQQALADTHLAQGDVQSYLAAAGAVEKYRKELESLKEAHDKLTSKTEKYIEGADPQVKAILANEKAMFEARAGGRDQDAAMFERSALALRRSARPDQLAEVAKIYGGKEVVDAIKELGRNQRELIDLWK
jgi:hypothetical protein